MRPLTAASPPAARMARSALNARNGFCSDDSFGPVKGIVRVDGDGDAIRCANKAGIAEFTDLRWITIQTTPRHYRSQELRQLGAEGGAIDRRGLVEGAHRAEYRGLHRHREPAVVGGGQRSLTTQSLRGCARQPR